MLLMCGILTYYLFGAIEMCSVYAWLQFHAWNHWFWFQFRFHCILIFSIIIRIPIPANKTESFQNRASLVQIHPHQIWCPYVKLTEGTDNITLTANVRGKNGMHKMKGVRGQHLDNLKHQISDQMHLRDPNPNKINKDKKILTSFLSGSTDFACS